MYRTNVVRASSWRAVWVLPLLVLGGAAHAASEEELLFEPQAETTEAQQQVLGYWTDEAMAAAKAIDMEVAEFPEPPAPEVAKEREAGSATEVWFASGGPEVKSFEGGSDRFAEPLSPVQEWGTYPFSYTRYRLFPNFTSTYTTFPYSTVGKLYFTIPGQGNYVCSGASVNSNNRSVVWTAGHCVYTRGRGWHTNFLFVPARRAGTNPFGVWTVRQAWTLNGWINGYFEYDMGALVMNRGGFGNQHIGNAVGWLGFLANASRQQHWHLHGYPAAPRNLTQTPPGAQFDGEHHEICAATWSTNNLGANGPATLGVGCDKTGGTSGGPWVVDFSGVAGLNNLLNSNNSYRYTGGPPNNLRLYGPYFTTGAINLRNAAQAVPVP